MRTVRIKLFKFEELSDAAKEKALEHFRFVEAESGWWQDMYDDAERVGIKITDFDADKYCNVKFIESPYDTAYKITKEHGEKTDTYTDAVKYLADWAALVEKYSDGINKEEVAEGNEYEFDQFADELDKQFQKDMGENYRILLMKDWEYKISDECVKNWIIANEQEFTEEGESAYHIS